VVRRPQGKSFLQKKHTHPNLLQKKYSTLCRKPLIAGKIILSNILTVELKVNSQDNPDEQWPSQIAEGLAPTQDCRVATA
jgi:hypothetical protein